ncbi:MAG: TetR/AcrR family transcriptional regulator [Spirochaetaceae bacterium]|jgi:TetR/AcrR family transcriptional regulator|nr:TetR/AcrR family transcriptional regulator [Spirochaetaceae bacterium]
MDTRSAIIEAALALFSRRGYESATIQEVVDAAGITKPTLYYYFGSKQGLLEAVAAEYGTALTGIIRKEAEYRRDLVTNLSGLFRETLDFTLAHRDFFRLMMGLFFSAPETTAFAAGRKLREELVSILEALFTDAGRDHGNMKNRQKIYAESFMGLLETWGILTVNDEIHMEDHLRYQIIHQYMYGIFS